MSFCRITGKSRGLPKPNYFPLLQPISPADAKRFCRITGKSYGLPSHHYIPVLLRTAAAGKRFGGADTAYGRRKHCILGDFRYVFPVFDAADMQQAALNDILSTATTAADSARFVYRVDERKLNLVFPARLEAAVRCGDVRDVQLDRDGDALLLRLRRGRQVTVELQDFDVLQNSLLDGEGPGDEAWAELQSEQAERKRRADKRANLSRVANIFEAKERREEQAEEAREAVEAQRKEVQRKRLEVAHRVKSERRRQGKFTRIEDVRAMRAECSLYVAAGGEAGGDLLKPLIESWDWQTYEREATVAGMQATTTEMPAPCTMKPQRVQATAHTAESVDAAIMVATSNVAVAFPAIPYIGEMKADAAACVTDAFIAAVGHFDPIELQTTADVAHKLTAHNVATAQLPQMEALQEILQHIHNGTPATLAGVSGIKVRLSGDNEEEDSRSVFLCGQTIQTAAGVTFVPGQTINTSTAVDQFVPGLTVCNAQTGEVSLIPGIVNAPAEPGQPSQFVSGHILADARQQQHFVAGQTMHFRDGVRRFVEGRTVCMSDGTIGFVAGHMAAESNVFVPGQTIDENGVANGVAFVPGQTMCLSADDGDGSTRFVPGQNHFDAECGAWTFVPGQTIDDRFVAGVSIVRNEGAKFVAGQFVNDVFVPGITTTTTHATDADGVAGSAVFVAGMNVATKAGEKFIHGQMVTSAHGTIFMPGKCRSVRDASNETQTIFEISCSASDMHIDEPTVRVDQVINPATLTKTRPSLSVFGNMIQTDKGIEFYPVSMSSDRLPAGKAIPGRLIKQSDNDSDESTKFVPGIMENGAFIPGQVVWTEHDGEQFIPGQVIETAADGLKFVPGQVLQTAAGVSKFVPGQSMRTDDGEVRFVPGQIVETRAGPTFIPGQVIGTEADGERFVPGQVVDTADGPRFVPGRVVETGDRVAFVPGQIVETADGPRFVAADLSAGADGEQHFSVQSFQIQAEELSLLKPIRPTQSAAAAPSMSTTELSIDAHMLRQLSEAGMRIGRQIEASAVDIVLQCTQDRRKVHEFGGRMGLTGAECDAAHTMFADLKTLILQYGTNNDNNVSQNDDDNTRCRNSRNSSNNDADGGDPSDDHRGCVGGVQGVHTVTVADVLVAAVLAVITRETQNTSSTGTACAAAANANHHPTVPPNPSQLYELISDALTAKLEQGDAAAAQLIELLGRAETSSMQRLMQTVGGRVERTLRTEERTRNECHIKASLADATLSESGRLDNLCTMLADRPEIAQTLRYLVDTDASVLSRIVEKLLSSDATFVTEADVVAQLTVGQMAQRAIIEAVQAMANEHIAAAFADGDPVQAAELVCQAGALAKALGEQHPQLDDAAPQLSDPAVRELLQRIVVMRQLSTRRPSMQLALRSLCADPLGARHDAQLRDLLRQAGSVMLRECADPQQALSDSSTVPMSVLCSDNQLAVEDYLLRRPTQQRTPSAALVIVKAGMQAVVPRESSHAVLTGQCAFTLLDETGIRHFEPLHVLSALNIGKQFNSNERKHNNARVVCRAGLSARQRFAIYACDMVTDETAMPSDNDQSATAVMTFVSTTATITTGAANSTLSVSTPSTTTAASTLSGAINGSTSRVHDCLVDNDNEERSAINDSDVEKDVADIGIADHGDHDNRTSTDIRQQTSNAPIFAKVSERIGA